MAQENKTCLFNKIYSLCTNFDKDKNSLRRLTKLNLEANLTIFLPKANKNIAYSINADKKLTFCSKNR